MFARVQAVIRQQLGPLKQCQLKGAWYALFVTLLCVGVGLLVPVGWAVSGFIDRFLTDRSEMFLGTPAVRYIAQLVVMLVFIAVGFLLMALTGLVVSRLRDSRFKRARAKREDAH